MNGLTEVAAFEDHGAVDKALVGRSARERRNELGQFLTSTRIADFMASMFDQLPRSVRLLDAGAGAGALTLAFVCQVCAKMDCVDSIEATLYEIDPEIRNELSATMRECRRMCDRAGIRFSFTVYSTDFIREISARLTDQLFGSPPAFNAAIANPPYRKIGAHSLERRALRSVGIETSNLYTGFIGLICRLLVPGGQIVAITPRSFCNGPYFRPFREEFLQNVELRRIHVFESRKAAFRDASVLQENIIFHAEKGPNQARSVVISSSTGEDGAEVIKNVHAFSEIVHPKDPERFIHIPSSPSHAHAKDVIENLRASLASLGLNVSTGPVVDFRLKKWLRQQPGSMTVPLLYPCHFNGGTVCWPKPNGKKPNAILENENTRRWLVPSGVYLLTKRFTSKEERRRLVACLFDPGDLAADWIGFENHLNFFHANGRGLERNLALGLFVFLNSTLVDQYFRRFSGHTQVNATDLRALAYPEREKLLKMGAALGSADTNQEKLDHIINGFLHGGR